MACAAEAKWRWAGILLPFACAAWLMIRLFYNSLHELAPDEAYYWVWSRHLAGGYLDHPPMVAWLIRGGTWLFGTSEFSVRSGAAVMAVGTILLTIGIARQLGSDGKIAIAVGWILLMSPFAMVLGSIVTPDTPACFFSAGALAAAIVACRGGSSVREMSVTLTLSRSTARRSSPQAGRGDFVGGGGWWLVFGLCVGLALDSKYTSVLVPAAVGLALLSAPAGRRHLTRPWFWLGAATALLVFWPVVGWNRAHDWASFRFQWRHGTGAESSSAPLNVAIYLGGQMAVYTPVLLVLGVIALGSRWKRVSQLPVENRLILLAATLPLVVFGGFSFRHAPEANWPVFAYFPLTVILGQWICENCVAEKMKWARIGITVAAVAMVAAQLPELMRLVPVRWMPSIPGPWEELYGWQAYGAELDAIGGGAVVYCTSYENAAEASFYTRSRPEVWTIDSDRPTAYDFFGGRPAPASLGKVVCVTRALSAAALDDPLPRELEGFGRVQRQYWETSALGRTVRHRRLIVAWR